MEGDRGKTRKVEARQHFMRFKENREVYSGGVIIVSLVQEIGQTLRKILDHWRSPT